MRVAIPTWDARVSPVFDVAKRLLVMNIEGDVEVSREETGLEATQVVPRARRVAELGVDVLIYGALSQPLEAMLVSAGVRVVPQTCGPVEEVLRAFVSGQLSEIELF